MATAANAQLKIELSRALAAMAAMTDSGDKTVFTLSGAPVWSNKSGFTPDIKPDGITSGRNLLSVHDDDNKVTVSAFKCNVGGTEYDVDATTATATRPATNVSKVISVVFDGSAVDVVAGTDGASEAFVETRGVAGGPPYIPVGEIEIGQIRLTASADAAIEAGEISQVDGTHTERADLPSYSMNTIGFGQDAEVSAKTNAYMEFGTALDDRHTGDTIKGVYAAVYIPAATAVQRAIDFVPAEYSHSLSSEEYYQVSVGSSSQSLGQGSFSVGADDGVTDQLLREKNTVSTVWFYPNKDEDAYVLMQGALGIKRTYPVSNQIKIEATMTCETPAADFAE